MLIKIDTSGLPGVRTIEYNFMEDDVLLYIYTSTTLVPHIAHYKGKDAELIKRELLATNKDAYIPLVKRLAEEAAGVRDLNSKVRTTAFHMSRSLMWGFLINRRGLAVEEARRITGKFSLQSVYVGLKTYDKEDKHLLPEAVHIRSKFNQLLKDNLLCQ